MRRFDFALASALLLLMAMPATAQNTPARYDPNRCRVVVVTVDNSRWQQSCTMRPGSFIQNCTRTFVPGLKTENRVVCS